MLQIAGLAKKNFSVSVIRMRVAPNHDHLMKNKKEEASEALARGKALAKYIRDKKEKIMADLKVESTKKDV